MTKGWTKEECEINTYIFSGKSKEKRNTAGKAGLTRLKRI